MATLILPFDKVSRPVLAPADVAPEPLEPQAANAIADTTVMAASRARGGVRGCIGRTLRRRAGDRRLPARCLALTVGAWNGRVIGQWV